MPNIICYKKNCKCKNTTASTNQIRYKEIEIIKDSHIIEIAYYPMPSCDKCEEPWIKVDKDHA